MLEDDIRREIREESIGSLAELDAAMNRLGYMQVPHVQEAPDIVRSGYLAHDKTWTTQRVYLATKTRRKGNLILERFQSHP